MLDHASTNTGELFASAHAAYLKVCDAESKGELSWQSLPDAARRSISEARASLFTCAERGHAKARYVLAEMAEEGRGCEQSHSKA